MFLKLKPNNKSPNTDINKKVTIVINREKLKKLCTGADGNLDKDLLRSITGMQHGKGMITEDAFKRLITLCGGVIDENYKITKQPDKALLKSITGMQAGKGMIDDIAFKRLI
jgi:hypothetical protein